MAAAAAATRRIDTRRSLGYSILPRVNHGATLRRKINTPKAPLSPEQVTSLIDRVRLHIERGQFALAVAACLQSWEEACELAGLRAQGLQAPIAGVLFGEHEAIVEACLRLGLHTVAEMLECQPKRILAEPGVSPDRLRAVGKELRNFLSDNEFDLLVRERSVEALELDSRADAQSDAQAQNDDSPI